MKSLAENTPVRLTRCGSCKRFKEHTCPRNDLYRKPETKVYPNFAEACRIFEEWQGEKKMKHNLKAYPTCEQCLAPEIIKQFNESCGRVRIESVEDKAFLCMRTKSAGQCLYVLFADGLTKELNEILHLGNYGKLDSYWTVDLLIKKILGEDEQ